MTANNKLQKKTTNKNIRHYKRITINKTFSKISNETMKELQKKKKLSK